MSNYNLDPLKNKKTALVLSGGVVKAASWHLGVAIALEELGFVFKNNHSPKNPELEISTYVGSSAGSLVNLYFASGYGPNDVIEATINKKNAKTTLKGITYADMLSLKRPQKINFDFKFYNPFEGLPVLMREMVKPMLSFPGLFTTEGLNRYMQEHVIISQDFNDYLADMFVVASKLDHSHKVIFGKYNYPSPAHDNTSDYYTDVKVSEAISASMSVPPFYAPYPITNVNSNQTYYYIDGEIRETLSTHVGVDNGCETIISSWTHTPYHYQDEIGSLVNYGLPAICTQAIYLMIQKKIVAHRNGLALSKDIIDTLNQYMKAEKFDTVHVDKITAILERKLNYKKNINFIDIYPDHKQVNVFFANTFSLDSDNAKKVISAGYKKTMEVFRNLEL